MFNFFFWAHTHASTYDVLSTICTHHLSCMFASSHIKLMFFRVLCTSAQCILMPSQSAVIVFQSTHSSCIRCKQKRKAEQYAYDRAWLSWSLCTHLFLCIYTTQQNNNNNNNNNINDEIAKISKSENANLLINFWFWNSTYFVCFYASHMHIHTSQLDRLLAFDLICINTYERYLKTLCETYKFVKI